MTIDTRPPKKELGFTETRDFERWMYNIHKKMGNSDATFDDLDMRSISPLIGMLQDVGRKLEALTRDTRNMKAEILAIKQKPAVTRTIQGKLAELERRIDQIEGDL